ncbi:PREDICTED: germin-like protein subfamily 1 member 16 [Populus euphratica]|uniref:Germin-like protein n=1 Tax=Populus euphratica TaxID=75702 RepID=A0AAJ6Y8P9_POPEU|nr:PREDICTED: germin-like protein subfamily 1 member 16 [Populus euphratica]
MQTLTPYPTNNTQKRKKERKEFKVASHRKTMMKVANLIAVFILLALASSFVTAYDPSPLQDFCVAIDDANSAVLVNGKLCKNPGLATPDDFSYSGLDVPGNTSNQLGARVNIITADLMPGLNTLGISLARIDLAPNGGLNPPHYHPRGSEVLLVLEGTLYAGFVTSNPDHRLFTKILKPGDLFVFPFGLIHFQLNIGKTPAVAIAALTSQNPGVNTVANAIFGASWPLYPEVLTTAFHLDKKLVEDLQSQEWVNPT